MSGASLMQDARRVKTPSSNCSSSFSPGKRHRRGPTVAPGISRHPAQAISSLSSASTHEGALSVFCPRQRRAFLVDSSADVSVFPASPTQKRRPVPSRLQAANGSSIRTFGTKLVSLSLPGFSVVHEFLLAEVRKPILGTDFFKKKNLLIDVSKCRLIRPDPGDPVVTVEIKA